PPLPHPRHHPRLRRRRGGPPPPPHRHHLLFGPALQRARRDPRTPRGLTQRDALIRHAARLTIEAESANRRRSRLDSPMPARLRPTAPIAAAAVLVGDPGRALMLAQELLEQPRMSNHARGLWGYSGCTPAGEELTIQATGIGGPSAAVVLADLAELGVRRAVRVGTCTALTAGLAPGMLLDIEEAHAWGGPGDGDGAPVRPDP